jgi:hypothetical protein
LDGEAGDKTKVFQIEREQGCVLFKGRGRNQHINQITSIGPAIEGPPFSGLLHDTAIQVNPTECGKKVADFLALLIVSTTEVKFGLIELWTQ